MSSREREVNPFLDTRTSRKLGVKKKKRRNDEQKVSLQREDRVSLERVGGKRRGGEEELTTNGGGEDQQLNDDTRRKGREGGSVTHKTFACLMKAKTHEK